MMQALIAVSVLAVTAGVAAFVFRHLMLDARRMLKSAVSDCEAARAMNVPLQRGMAEAEARTKAVDTEARETLNRVNAAHVEEVNDLLTMLSKCSRPEDVDKRLEAAGFMVSRTGVKA